MQGQRRRCQRVLNQAGRTPDDRLNQGERTRDRGRSDCDTAGEETPATLSVSTAVYEHTEEQEVQITSSKLVSK